jgi:hypothetical protein
MLDGEGSDDDDGGGGGGDGFGDDLGVVNEDDDEDGGSDDTDDEDRSSRSGGHGLTQEALSSLSAAAAASAAARGDAFLFPAQTPVHHLHGFRHGASSFHPTSLGLGLEPLSSLPPCLPLFVLPFYPPIQPWTGACGWSKE